MILKIAGLVMIGAICWTLAEFAIDYYENKK